MSQNELGDNVNDAVLRIEKALDLRFEADTTLYITKEDTDKIKHCLANNNYQNLSAFTSRLGQNVVAKVVLKNSWLISLDVNKDFNSKKILEKIFSEVSDDFFVEIAGIIVNDKVFTLISFKEFIEKLYYKKIPIEHCEKIFNNSKFKLNSRVICFQRYIGDYAQSNSGAYICREISSVFKNHPDIERNVNYQLLSNLTPQIEDKQDVAKWLIEEQIKKKTHDVWSHALLSLGNVGFEEAIRYLSNKNDSRNETCRYLIEKSCPKFFAKNESIEPLMGAIFDLYKGFRSYHYNLIKMLTPGSFFDKDIANELLNQFESHTEFPKATEKFISEIRSWSKDDQNGYDTIEKMKTELGKPSHDVNNEKTLEYFSRQLKKSDMKIVNAFYEECDQDDLKLTAILSCFFANSFKSNPHHELSKIDFPANYIDKICDFIVIKRIKTKYSKLFLEKHNKIALITTLFER
jgi:hypothetical protein